MFSDNPDWTQSFERFQTFTSRLKCFNASYVLVHIWNCVKIFKWFKSLKDRKVYFMV